MSEGIERSSGPISFRDDDLRQWLEQLSELSFQNYHESAGIMARSELYNWKHAQIAALRRVILPLGWATCLARIVGGPTVSGGMGTLLAQEAEDSFAPDVLGRACSHGEAHGIDERELLAWLRTLDPVTDIALRRAFASWWADEASEATVESFGKHGIRSRE